MNHPEVTGQALQILRQWRPRTQVRVIGGQAALDALPLAVFAGILGWIQALPIDPGCRLPYHVGRSPMCTRLSSIAVALTLLAVLAASAAPAATHAQEGTTPAVELPACAVNLPPDVSAVIFPRRVVYLDAELTTGAQVIVEAGSSRDPEGSFMEYSFDVDGDGSYTPFFFNSAGAENITMPGPFVTTVRVRDEGGAIGTLALHMTARQFEAGFVYPGYAMPSLAVVAGRPAMAFMGGDGLYFAINSRYDGGGAWTVSRVLGLDPSNTGIDTRVRALSLAVVTGRPAIVLSYREGGKPWQLRFVLSDLADGSGTWRAEQVVNLAQNGVPALGTIGVRAAIAYAQDGSVTLLGGGARSSAGAVMVSENFEFMTSFDVGAAPPGTHSGIVQVGGPPATLPALAFLDARKGSLVFAVNQQADGLGRWDQVAVEPQAGNIGTPSLAMVNGRPAIAYRDAAKGHLKVATASSADGRGAWKVTVVDPTTRTGDIMVQSLAQIDGRAGVAYEHQDRGLLFAYDPGFDSGRYWPAAVVDPRPLAFSQPMMMAPSLAPVGGRPGIAYLRVGGISFATAR